MNDYSELERLAEAARVANHDERGPDEAFQEAIHPEVVLELIAENKRLAELKAHLTELRETHGFESWAAALVEVDRLRAENEALRNAGAEALKFVAFAFSEGVEGAEQAGRSIELAVGIRQEQK